MPSPESGHWHPTHDRVVQGYVAVGMFDQRYMASDVLGLASSLKPGQARPQKARLGWAKAQFRP